MQENHSPALSVRDFGRDDRPYEMIATGTVRGGNTPHGPKLIVECRHRWPTNEPQEITRAFFVSFKSRSYVRLCEIFGDNIARWSGPFSVRIVRDGRDGKRRVEVV